MKQTLINLFYYSSIINYFNTPHTSGMLINVLSKCNWPVDVYNHNPDTRNFDHICKIKNKYDKSCRLHIKKSEYHSGLIKNILGEQATLFEFSKTKNGIFYDISVIPPGSGNCFSWKDCFSISRKKGFNDALSVSVKESNQHANQRCKNLVCDTEQCGDAYLYPFDDEKTFYCGVDTNFTLTYC